MFTNAQPTQPVLSAAGVSKHYGSTCALNNIHLRITPGESVAIMGPSGSGKTTLMHVLSGILLPDSGHVNFSGPTEAVEITMLSEELRAKLRRESFGFVFQEGLLLPELSAQENVALPLMLTCMPRAAAEEYARGQLNQLGLAGMHDRRLGELSGGQAQRVAIARAQVSQPSVVFADEPTGALDSVTSAAVLDALLGSTVQRGGTLVMVTHDSATAARCDRIIRVQDGAIVSDSTQHVPNARMSEAGGTR
ncbi:ABC transporter ATP-binding protein [Micrococcoides hystricis]|uniref:ABC transporter ATP-binding protein n=1 Tax=Micrococcoides hystricis TaxID=1572761 RepID=A0ABV6PD23_9MICC